MYIYTTEYDSALTKGHVLPFVTTWVDLEHVMLSQMSQRKMGSYIISVWNLKRPNLEKDQVKWWLPWTGWWMRLVVF